MVLAQGFNLGLRFILELCLLAALGYGGYQLEQSWLMRVAAGIGLPLLVAIIWSMYIAPKAANLLAEPWRFGLEMVLFGLGAGALWLAERPSLSASFFVVFIVNRLLIMAWAQ